MKNQRSPPCLYWQGGNNHIEIRASGKTARMKLDSSLLRERNSQASLLHYSQVNFLKRSSGWAVRLLFPDTIHILTYADFSLCIFDSHFWNPPGVHPKSRTVPQPAALAQSCDKWHHKNNDLCHLNLQQDGGWFQWCFTLKEECSTPVALTLKEPSRLLVLIALPLPSCCLMG